MRLITKATLLYLFIMSVVFSIAGIVTYQMVMERVARETDYSLAQNMNILKESIREGNPLDALQNQKNHIEKVTTFQPKEGKREIKDFFHWTYQKSYFWCHQKFSTVVFKKI